MEGNEFYSIDPFMFFLILAFLCTRPIHGQSISSWRTFSGFHDIRKMEQQGVYKWTATWVRSRRGTVTGLEWDSRLVR